MNHHNEAFQNSLRCLQHPVSIVSIIVLLFNDHVLKIISPSWLTGKLSDFAGLFFFPFIVAILLTFLFPFLKLNRKKLGYTAFGFVAVWFVLIKTLPLINLLTSGLVSFFTNGTVQIVLDPTDLLALTGMLPAWKLWDQPQVTIPSTRLGYIAFLIGGFAAIATSPIEWTVNNVTDLVFSDEGIIYAADRKTFSQESYPIAKSLDAGLTWEKDFEKDGLPGFHENKYPIQVCNSRVKTLTDNCYRVTSNHQLERYWNDTWVKVFPSDVSIKAYDLILFTIDDTNYMLVAIGEAGVMRRAFPEGNWEIIPVIHASSR